MQNSLVHSFTRSLINYKISIEHIIHTKCLLGEYSRQQGRRGPCSPSKHKQNINLSFRNLETSAQNLLLQAVDSFSSQMDVSGSYKRVTPTTEH